MTCFFARVKVSENFLDIEVSHIGPEISRGSNAVETFGASPT